MSSLGSASTPPRVPSASCSAAASSSASQALGHQSSHAAASARSSAARASASCWRARLMPWDREPASSAVGAVSSACAPVIVAPVGRGCAVCVAARRATAASRCRCTCACCSAVSFHPSRRGAGFHMRHASSHATLGSRCMSFSVGMGTVGGSVSVASRCASVSSRDGRMCLLPSSPAGMSVPRKHSGRALGRKRMAGDLASASAAACAPSALPTDASPCSGSACPHVASASAYMPVASRALAAIHSAYARSATSSVAARSVLSVFGVSMFVAAASVAAAQAHAVSARSSSVARACGDACSGVAARLASSARAWAFVAALRRPCASGVPGSTCATRTMNSASTCTLLPSSLWASARMSRGCRAPTARGAVVASHNAPGESSSRSAACCSTVRAPLAR